MRSLRWVTLTAAAIAALPVSAGWAQDAYVVGITAGLTGPAASSQAPIIEALRVYVEQLNARGGVNGHPVQLILEDDLADASKAAANVTKLLNRGDVILIGNSSFSTTYVPVQAETKAAGMPLWFVGSVCPKETMPPADPLQFCSTGYSTVYDSRVALTYIKDTVKGPAKVGMAGMATPLSRTELDVAAKVAPDFDLTSVDVEIIPPSAADYTPYATKLVAANPDWVFAYGGWSLYVKTFEALRRIGWTGKFICYSNAPAEDELARIKDPSFYIFASNALFRDNTPAHREALAALNNKMNYPATQGAEGWISGMVLEAALKRVSWPPSPAKMAAALTDLKVDMQGLRAGELEWTKDNHFRLRQSYKVYHWDNDKQSVVPVSDWIGFDIK
jgi:ABC-type branched-subunit amino acid transport system substrate-binding protein